MRITRQRTLGHWSLSTVEWTHQNILRNSTFDERAKSTQRGNMVEKILEEREDGTQEAGRGENFNIFSILPFQTPPIATLIAFFHNFFPFKSYCWLNVWLNFKQFIWHFKDTRIFLSVLLWKLVVSLQLASISLPIFLQRKKRSRSKIAQVTIESYETPRITVYRCLFCEPANSGFGGSHFHRSMCNDPV